MPKIEANSVNYNSLIGSDFKNMAPPHSGPSQRTLFTTFFVVLFIGAVIVSVVLANSSQSTLVTHTISSSASNDKTNANTNTVSLTLNLSEKEEVKPSSLLPNPFEPVAIENKVIVDDLQNASLIENSNRITVEVKKGDTLSSIFNDLDIHSEITRIVNLGKKAKPLKRIYPGQKLHFNIYENRIEKIELEKSVTESLYFISEGDSFVIKESSRELDKTHQVATGIINNSLFLAGQNAGMSDKLIMDLAGIFGWDIDFALDIRQGDNFTVLYEELYLNGEKISDGSIIAAEFVNDGRTHRAYRYTDSNNKTEYYAPDGKSMRKPFIRTPVDLARISSHFNLRRKHPILNKIRAHKGVDYAARTGTPIKATGNGKVVHRGNKGGYGKTIILRHGNTYTTLYAHMSKYARGTGIGSRVKQGQIIGYIGSTGLATGPHLHYEFRVNGVHRNPLRVKLPSAKPLPESEMDSFKASIQPLVVQLDAYAKNAIVMRDL